MQANTKYAPAERSTAAEISEQARMFLEAPLLKDVVNGIPDLVFILNDNRQIVFVNTHENMSCLGVDKENVIGQRPGEAFKCVNSEVEEGGCGTSEFCRTCGAVNAILSSLKGKADQQECRITQIETAESLDLRVCASPLKIKDRNYTIFAIKDIRDEKRRRALEKIFFHDVLNTAGGLKGISEMLISSDVSEDEELKSIVLELSNKIIEDIQSQKELSAAENNELELSVEMLVSSDIINSSVKAAAFHPSANSRDIEIEGSTDMFHFYSDKRLLRRILTNLLKNALEASLPGDKIVIGSFKKDDNVGFTVWNNAFIPRVIQNQIFQRSFSTKGDGRGLGTYSIRLLTERYLKGEVKFITSEEEGTKFFITLPKSI